MELFDNINKNNKELKERNTSLQGFQFKPYSYDYLDNLIKLLDNNAINDDSILRTMEYNIDVLDGIFVVYSISDVLWNNNRFIDLLINLFSDSNKYNYIKLKVFFINNMDKVNLVLANLFNNIEDNHDFLIKLYRLVETLYGSLIDEIKAIDTLDFDCVPKKEWYFTICAILGYSTTNIRPVEVLNNLLLKYEIGDNVANIINIYYIFFGKEFSVVALENIYPSNSDLLYTYGCIYKDPIDPVMIIDDINSDILYKRTENVLKATREILGSLSTPDLVKILSIIDANSRLVHKQKPTINLFASDDPKIKAALTLMYKYNN